MLPGFALAHPGHAEAVGWVHGFLHPFTGIDHILAMVCAGLFAVRLGGRGLWLVPASFVCAMAAGGFMGMAHLPVPAIETGIGLSVAVLGAAVASGWRPATALAAGVAGLFAIFHGYAHGAEMPAAAPGYQYGAGFLAATAVLHGIGIGVGFASGALDKNPHRPLMRLAGGAISLCGIALLTGAL